MYRVDGYVSAMLAEKVTGFSDDDLELLWTAIINMFEHDRSAARGKMCVRKLFISQLYCERIMFMMTLVSYDVSTTDIEGRRRLRRIAKECVNYGQRVQNSVFEIDLDYSSFLKLKNKLLNIIDENKDSLRSYYLGNNWRRRIEHFGAKETYDPEDALII